MRTVIVSKLSGLFFITFGRWAADPHGATIFANPEQAREFITRERLTDVRPMVLADAAVISLSAV